MNNKAAGPEEANGGRLQQMLNMHLGEMGLILNGKGFFFFFRRGAQGLGLRG